MVATISALRSSVQQRRRVDLWRVGMIATGALVALPIVAIFFVALFPQENIWGHLSSTVLPRYVSNTVWLLVGVGVGVTLLGLTSAWLVTIYDFPLRRVLEWSLLLPLAVPAYVVAYVYTDLLEYSGLLQSTLRQIFDWQSRRDYWFPEIRSLTGAATMMSLVLYPYVYMLCRAAFLELSPSLLDSARILGMGPLRMLASVVIPVIRPALLLGVSLALMEALNDFGTVDFFAVQTLSAGLYDTWLNMNNLGGAAQIAMVMLFFVALLLAAERISRHRQRYFQSGDRMRSLERIELNGKRRLMATVACLLPVVLGFILPALVLLRYAIVYFDESWTPQFKSQIFNSLALSGTAAIAATLLATIVAYSGRLYTDRLSKSITLVSMLGYAMPGVVLALGLLVAFGSFDRSIDNLSRSIFDVPTGLILSGGIFAVICAYVIRFLAISVTSVESSMSRITPSMELAARSLGFSTMRTLLKVHLPLLRTGLLTALLVVFVDCMKELPATLILRPFNFDTLAVGVYHQAGDEMIERASLGALMIVLSGVVPVILLTRAIQSRPRPGQRASPDAY